MELREFVAATLRQIAQGVSDSKEEVVSAGASLERMSESSLGFRDIEFDIAVTTNSVEKGEAGAGIFVWAVGAGAKETSESERSSVSRIRFTVSMKMPG